jgi:hypothetical protein
MNELVTQSCCGTTCVIINLFRINLGLGDFTDVAMSNQCEVMSSLVYYIYALLASLEDA